MIGNFLLGCKLDRLPLIASMEDVKKTYVAKPVWKKYKWNRSIHFKVSVDFEHWSICTDLI